MPVVVISDLVAAVTSRCESGHAERGVLDAQLGTPEPGAAIASTAAAWRRAAAADSGPAGSSTTNEEPARTRSLTQRESEPG